MIRSILCVVLIGVLAFTVTASNNMGCTICTIGLGLVEQHSLQLKLESKLKAKCEKQGKLLKSKCEDAVEKTVTSLLKKARPETLCDKMNMCDGYQQCQLYPEWPLPSLPASPQDWPTERRLLDVKDLGGDHHILKKYLTEFIQKYKLDDAEKPNFYTWARVLASLLRDLHSDNSEDGDVAEDAITDGADGCDKKDIQCHIQAVVDHKPIQDGDGDLFSSTKKELRGTDWRGTDCDDTSDAVYPGRKTGDDASVDHNCNGIVGGNATASYEDMFCSNSQQRGLIMLGDSATAHFHLPPQWLTADGWNVKGLKTFEQDELDFPMCSWGTGSADPELCPYQYPMNGNPDGKVVSLYTLMRERNMCMNNDFQNIGVNGARITSSDGLVNAMARDGANDHPALVWLTLLGNDVCNGHPGTDHMTTPEAFYDSAMASLQKLDAQLPPNSFVVSVALFDGELLYDTMHDQQHPMGPAYHDVYDYMNCMEVSPCLGWLNSNQTMREATTERAHELDAVYEKIVETQASTFKNFQYIYFKPEWKAMFAQFAEDYGVENLPHLIEASDGFHPSQTGNAMFAQEFFNFLEKNHPDAIGPINPFNEEISQMFFSA
jgi:lysophospholipase L1-like esterase